MEGVSVHSMEGKTCVITGANSGIGRASAEQLAEMGARVVMVCRSREKGERAKAEVEKKGGSSSVELMVADLASLDSVRKLAHEYQESHDSLHVLLNNAGVARIRRSLTVDGFETTFQVNYLPPLSPKLRESFQESLALWDDTYPEFQRVVNDAASEVRRLAGPIKSRLEYLKPPIHDKDVAPLPTMEVDTWLQEVDRSYPQFHAIRTGLMMWYKELGEALSQYRKAAAELNIEVDRFNLRKAMGLIDTAAVEKVAGRVRPIVERTIAALDHVEAELANIT